MNDNIELVIARLETMPESLIMHIGNNPEGYDKYSLIEHVKKQDKLGKIIVEMQMGYIQALIKGELYENFNHKTKA